LVRLSIILLVVIGLAGCKKEPASTEGAPTQTAAETQAEPSKPAPAAIKLVNQGSEPRRALRSSRGPGRNEHLKIRVDTELDMRVAMLNAKQAPRSVTFELSVRTNGAVREGTAVFSFTVDEASAHHAANVPPKTRDDREEAMASMRGLQGGYRVDSLGAIQEVVMNLPADASQELWNLATDLRWAIRQLTAPFPVEPIGAGATWTVGLSVEQDGVKANQVSSLELTELQPQLVTVKWDVQQSAAPQTFRNPGSPTEVELTELTGEGAGVIKWNPTQPLPHSATMTSTVTRHITYGFQGKRVQSTILTRRTLTISGPEH
jgi:hypothetical protein